jgi:hypothetical protein
MSDVADEWHDPTFCWVADTKKFGGAYSGELRPFVGSVDLISSDDTASGVSAAELDAVKSATRREPTHSIVVAAMCNDRVDHQVLCEIVRYISARHQGIVDFGGEVVADVIQHPGLVRCQSFEDGKEYWTQFGSAEFCEWWLSQPSFHMIK